MIQLKAYISVFNLYEWRRINLPFVFIMTERREIDLRDIDQLMLALSDVQLAALFGIPVCEISSLRRMRKRLQIQTRVHYH